VDIGVMAVWTLSLLGVVISTHKINFDIQGREEIMLGRFRKTI